MGASQLRRPTPLSSKLLTLGVVPAVIMFVVLMVFFTSARLEDARRDLAGSSQMLADSLAPAVEYAVVSGNTETLEQILAQALNRSRAQWIRVSDVMGDEVGFVSTGGEPDESLHTYEVYESEILQPPIQLGTGHASPDWFEPDYDFGNSSLRVGSVEVGVSGDSMAAIRQDILWTSLVVGLALLLFTLLIVKQSVTSIMEPVRGLSERVNELIRRNYQQATPSRHRNTREIYDLEMKLNELALHLQELQNTRDSVLRNSERAREKAEAANKAKSEFLAVMSHELRTPLNGVLGMIELTGDDPLSGKQEEYLQTAKQSTEDLLTVIDDILDYSRLDRGLLELETREFDLKGLISNCTASYRHEASLGGLNLQEKFIGEWPDNPLVMGDPHRLRQVLASLIDNAIKFTGDGTILVNANWFAMEEHCMVLNCTITDSGSGIPAERLYDIFNTFQQLDSSTSREAGGTGMGLPLVQRLVELMGGHVHVESDPGIGSSFRFEVPFELKTEQPVSAPLPEKLRKPPAKSQTAKALVVEDNLVNQRVTRAMLARLGFDTNTAGNGKEALELIRTTHEGYDVILMDCEMPIMNGYDATRFIREWEQSNGQTGTPIIALTANAMPGTEEACKDCGMNDYLAKPIRKDTLRATLARWIRI